MTVARKHRCRRTAYFGCKLACELGVCNPSRSVGSENSTHSYILTFLCVFLLFAKYWTDENAALGLHSFTAFVYIVSRIAPDKGVNVSSPARRYFLLKLKATAGRRESVPCAYKPPPLRTFRAEFSTKIRAA